MSANEIQHGGTHYAAEYQHWDFVADLRLNYYVANATKYLVRHDKKNGREDVLKATHYMIKLYELIEQRRMPPPVYYQSWEQDGREALVSKFLKANNKIKDSAVSKFMYLSTCPKVSDDFYEAGKIAVGILNDTYGGEGQNVLSKNGFTSEGFSAGVDFWRCKSCMQHFTLKQGLDPKNFHSCKGAASGVAKAEIAVQSAVADPASMSFVTPAGHKVFSQNEYITIEDGTHVDVHLPPGTYQVVKMVGSGEPTRAYVDQARDQEGFAARVGDAGREFT